jgi:PIN domain nuclease of toxin-antitoxin system
MTSYILDACALIAVLNKENGAESVNEILSRAKDGTVNIHINIINLLEVYYGVLREYGNDTAENIISAIKSSPVGIIDIISDSVFKQAGRLKAKYKISLADSLVLAEGIVRDSVVISSDHHEFDLVEQSEGIKFFWFR